MGRVLLVRTDMTQPLFISPTIPMEKLAYTTTMEGDPEDWPVGVLQEAYKQLPFLKSYETEVEFDKMDSSRGYGVGKMLVWPAKIEKVAAARKRQLISVPIIIRDREMCPLDVYVHGDSMKPMNQEKVASILLTPHLFIGAASRATPSGADLQQQLSPPSERHQYSSGSISKQASAGLLKVASEYIPAATVRKVAEELHNDAPLRYAYTNSAVLSSAMGELLRGQELSKTASQQRSVRRLMTAATSMQITEDGNGYLVKTASHRCFNPQTTRVTRFDVQKSLSPEEYVQLQDTGSITSCLIPCDGASVGMKKEACVAKRAGLYKVARGGREDVGFVIPCVVDFDNHPLPMAVFAGPSSHALQEKVAGVFLQCQELPDASPSGQGVFVYQEGDKAFATEPVKVVLKSKVAHEHGTSEVIHAVRLGTGEKVRIYSVDGIQKMAMVGNEVALPKGMVFLPLNGKMSTVEGTMEGADVVRMRKLAGAQSVEVLYSDGEYLIRGDRARPFGRLGHTESEAEFALATLGVSDTKGMLKEAAKAGSVVVPKTHRVVPESSMDRAALEKAASHIRAARGIKADTLKPLAILGSPAFTKEASVLLTKENANTILALNFVTPENASVYVNYLPDIEKTANKLAEILVASRLGIDDIRESAAKNAMMQVSAVVDGLETLKARIS